MRTPWYERGCGCNNCPECLSDGMSAGEVERPVRASPKPQSTEPPMDDWRIAIGHKGNPRTPRQCERCLNDCEGFLCPPCRRREDNETREMMEA